MYRCVYNRLPNRIYACDNMSSSIAINYFRNLTLECIKVKTSISGLIVTLKIGGGVFTNTCTPIFMPATITCPIHLLSKHKHLRFVLTSLSAAGYILEVTYLFIISSAKGMFCYELKIQKENDGLQMQCYISYTEILP